MGRDILFRQDAFIFSYRVAGILIREGKVLLQRPKDDDYALIGGHVTAFETAADALIREYREELHADIRVKELMAVGEIFFPWGKKPCHQIGMYYAVELENPGQIPLTGTFHGYDELDNERIDLDFCWVPLEDLRDQKVYPLELMPRILNGGDGVFHFVSKQLGEV